MMEHLKVNASNVKKVLNKNSRTMATLKGVTILNKVYDLV